MRPGSARLIATVVAESVSITSVAALLVPALLASGVPSGGVWRLSAWILATHAVGAHRRAAVATPIALLAAAAVWVLVHLDDPGHARAAVGAGLLLWLAEEARDISLTLRRPAVPTASTLLGRLPRTLGIAAVALLVDAGLVSYLQEPWISGWIWRVLGAAGLVGLVGLVRLRTLRDS